MSFSSLLVSNTTRSPLVNYLVKIVPIGATKPVPSWSAEYSVSIAALPKITDSNPLYKSASELYREFIFEEPAAEWLRGGMIKNRLPDHLKNSHVWLNTGWQCHDVFEVRRIARYVSVSSLCMR